ncbi:MAG: response regulator [Dehalococcoidales bacterium]|nr:response regulator [Dehalococcoidales bacterium]
MSGKVLVIEDDPTSLRLIEYALKQRGYQVMTTLNGLEGIITAQKEEPDLIILDIMLPGIDGFEVCRRLHSGSQTTKIPILIISAKTQKEDINAGFKAGADDYLLKPASPTEIINRVESLLSKKITGQARVVSFVNTSEIPGLTMVMVNVAAALVEQEKRVTLIDASNSYKGQPGKNKVSSEQDGRVILEVDTNGNGGQEPGLETLPSGIRVLHVDDVFDDNNGASEVSLDLVQKIGKSNDYLLVDLPLKPSHFTTSILKSSDLVMILSDYRIDNLITTRNAVTLLNFLGITAEKMAVVLADSEGKNQNLTTANMKPFVEANLGIMLVEVVSFDAKMYQLFYLDSQPVIQSNPNQKLAQDLKRIARYVATYSYTGQEPKQSKKATPPAEVKIDADK